MAAQDGGTPSTPQTMSFEAALAGLEAVVCRLEGGEASLEESIALYEQGVELKRRCEVKLADAQARIDQIRVGADGQAAGTTPFAAAVS